VANAARRASVRAQEKEAQQTDGIRRVVITSLMSNHDGRQYIQDVLEQSHVFQTSFSDNYGTMCFMEGERNFGLRVLNDVMESCPEQFIQMMREKNARTQYDEVRDAKEAVEEPEEEAVLDNIYDD
jgi:hypothetical protein